MTTTTPTFVAWLRQHRHKATPIGDLARDWAASARPAERRGSTPQHVLAELDRHSAADIVYEALDAAVRQWQQDTEQTVTGIDRFADEDD